MSFASGFRLTFGDDFVVRHAPPEYAVAAHLWFFAWCACTLLPPVMALVGLVGLWRELRAHRVQNRNEWARFLPAGPAPTHPQYGG